MARTLIAFRSTAFSNTAYTNVSPASNDSTVNSDFTGKSTVVPSTNIVVAAYGYSSTAADFTRYQILAPSIKTQPIQIDQVDDQATSPNDTADYTQFFDNGTGRQLVVGENLQVQAITSGSVTVIAGVWLDDGIDTSVYGKVIPGVRATAATTLTAGVWTTCPLTFDNQLEAGTYAVCGMYAYSATGVFARVNISGAAYRMGVKMNVDNFGLGNDRWRLGRFGRRQIYGNIQSWGAFLSTNPPQVDVLAVAADTAETFVLDLVKLS
jgi:hypothetical protein